MLLSGALTARTAYLPCVFIEHEFKKSTPFVPGRFTRYCQKLIRWKLRECRMETLNARLLKQWMLLCSLFRTNYWLADWCWKHECPYYTPFFFSLSSFFFLSPVHGRTVICDSKKLWGHNWTFLMKTYKSYWNIYAIEPIAESIQAFPPLSLRMGYRAIYSSHHVFLLWFQWTSSFFLFSECNC